MKEFDLTSKGLLSQAEKAKDPEWVPSRADQAQVVLSLINTLAASSSAQIVAYGRGEDSSIDMSAIRATMRGVGKQLDKDFANLLGMVADLSFSADLHAALAWQAGRMKKLKELGFISCREGSTGEFHYVLIVHPLVAVKKLLDEGIITKGKTYNILSERVIEVGASWEG